MKDRAMQGWRVTFSVGRDEVFTWRGNAERRRDALLQAQDAFKTAHAITATAQGRTGEPFPDAWSACKVKALPCNPDPTSESWGIGQAVFGDVSRGKTQREADAEDVRSGLRLLLRAQSAILNQMDAGGEAVISALCDTGGSGTLKHIYMNLYVDEDGSSKTDGRNLTPEDHRIAIALVARYVALTPACEESAQWHVGVQGSASATLRAVAKRDQPRLEAEAREALSDLMEKIGAARPRGEQTR